MSGEGKDKHPRTLVVRGLVRRAKAGDLAAFDALVLEFEAPILRLAVQMTGAQDAADDVFQETFLRAYRYLENFQEDREFFSWLYKIAINCCYNELRRHAPAAVSDAVLQLQPAAAPDPETRFADRQADAALARLLDCLSPQERAVFTLKELHDLDSREVGEILGISQVTVRRHLSRARQRLQRILGDQPRALRILPDEG